MAKRPSVQEILEAARKGGAAKPQAAPEPEVVESAPVEEAVVAEKSAPEPVSAPAAAVASPAVNVPTAASLGRPLTLKEKLAAARAGGAAAAAPTASPQPAAPVPQAAEAEAEPTAAASPAAKPAPAVPPPAKPLGRPLTLQEKLAAARSAAGGAAATTAAAPAAPGKPTAAKAGAAAAPAAKAAGAARALPPLEKISDPRDLAEALRQAGAKKAKEVAAKAASEAATAKAASAPAKAAPPKPQTVLPKPAKNVAAAAPAGETGRRGFMIGSFFVSWIAVAWSTFTAGCAALTVMSGRFMFPNVLAEPPSTIKVGLPTNYDPEDVNERFKAEWGFWIVRSARYNGQDVIYALQSVCTHLGCPPNWLANEQKFKCPCHGSGFYISGINFEGPAPRPLERFKVTMADDGQILVDKSQKFQQELGQWSDPDSFITV